MAVEGYLHSQWVNVLSKAKLWACIARTIYWGYSGLRLLAFLTPTISNDFELSSLSFASKGTCRLFAQSVGECSEQSQAVGL